jgi:hypothetical protein
VFCGWAVPGPHACRGSSPPFPPQGWIFARPHLARFSLASVRSPYLRGDPRSGRRPLRPHGVPPHRSLGPQAARYLTGPLAQLRRRPARAGPRDPAARVRPWRDALRPGEQLRPTVRVGRGDVRPHPRPGLPSLPRRARALDQGRLRHVARPVRRVGLPQVPACLTRPVARAHGARLRRHLLLAPLRSGDAARGDDGRAAHGGAAGQGAVRRHLLLLGGEDAGGGGRRS